MLTHDFTDSMFYRLSCTCGNEDDAIDLEIELDDETREVSVHVYSTQKSKTWKDTVDFADPSVNDPNWLWDIKYRFCEFMSGLKHRCNVTWTVWTMGYVELQSTTIMTQQQALNWAEALRAGVNKLQQRK